MRRTDRVGAEPAVLDIAPAIDLAEHRAESAVRGVYPIFQRAHRARTERRDAPDGHDALGPMLAVKDEVNASLHEVDLLNIEADECASAQTRGGQQ